MTGQIRRVAFVVVITAALGACGFFQNTLFEDSFWASSPLRQNDEAELGIAELAKGNYVTAEGHFQKALKANPRDIHALLGAGILYHNTGQLTKAREMYEAVLAIRPDESMQFVVWSNISTRPASQIASVNLSLLDSGGVSRVLGSGAPGQESAFAPAMPAPAPKPPEVSGAPASSAMLGRGPATTAPASAALPPSSMGEFAGGTANVISRFSTIRALRDQGLITQEEHAARRRANLGALLPLTAPPPAAGLDRPVPTTGQISGRLRAIGRALEMRAISVSQHAAERSMILDALMPSAPVVVANPGMPPGGLLEAADAVRQLEQLKNAGYINSDEYAKERQAIERAMQPAPPAARPSAMKALSAAPVTKSGVMRSSGSSPAIHLASYRTRANADKGWGLIRRAHQSLLGGLDHQVTRVKLGKKGTYYRLKAGPLQSSRAAKDMCRKLKRRRQFCEPSVMKGG